MFPLLSEKFESTPHVDISEPVVQHLTQLSHKLDYYFPEDPRPGNLWILNPFAVNSTAEEVLCPRNLRINSLSSLKTAVSSFDIKKQI